MARKADDLLADLDQLGSEEQVQAEAQAASQAQTVHTDEEDALAEIEKQLAVKPATVSRPTTPRVSSSTTSATNKSPKRAADYTPATTSQGSSARNSSEERARGGQAQTRSSGEGSRSFHTAQTPAPTDNAVTQAQGGGGGWWGSMFSAASAAVKQAESLAKNIQTNEEAQKWVDQIRGNVNLQNLQHLGMLLGHLAPPPLGV
jgi:hypothetical protein